MVPLLCGKRLWLSSSRLSGSRDIQPFGGLPGDAGDEVEVLVEVQDRELGKLGGGDDEVEHRGRAVLPSTGEQGEDSTATSGLRRGLARATFRLPRQAAPGKMTRRWLRSG